MTMPKMHIGYNDTEANAERLAGMMFARLRVNCLLASEREKVCDSHHFSYTGTIPCTGQLKCIYCNTIKE